MTELKVIHYKKTPQFSLHEVVFARVYVKY